MDLDAKLSRTLQKLEASLQTAAVEKCEEVSQFNNYKRDATASDEEDGLLLDQMLRLLLHKDVLYGPLKEITLKVSRLQIYA